MKFDVYCDESCPDTFTSNFKKDKHLVIGSIWFDNKYRVEFKKELKELCDYYKIGPEFKWNKISPSGVDFYCALIDWFFQKEELLRFRSIVVAGEKVDLLKFHHSDQELGFYKFYYQMLHHWIYDFNEYFIFCDYKTNSRKDRLKTLKKCLSNANITSHVINIQAIKSDESRFIQLTDVLTGLVSSIYNSNTTSPAKLKVKQKVEEYLNHNIHHTSKEEKKFNIFLINLQGGW